MNVTETDRSRRHMLQMLGAGLSVGLSVGLGAGLLAASSPALALSMQGKTTTTPVPPIPSIGLGSWITFNVGNDPRGVAMCTDVMRAFFQEGGRVIDSSPMYGSSQAVIGEGLKRLGNPESLLAIDKVWTRGAASARSQLGETLVRWDRTKLFLLQVHNLLDWDVHLPVLQDLKQGGVIQHVGVTTSHGRRHREVERIIEEEGIDFVQLTYNMTHRAAEARLLPLAQERGVRVICNRPFDGGRLIRRAKEAPFPAWAREAGFQGWPDFLLKYLVSHPAVALAIPATTRVDHVRENMQAAKGFMPDAAMRRRMVSTLEAL